MAVSRYSFIFLCVLGTTGICASDEISAIRQLRRAFEYHRFCRSDINQHLSLIRKLAAECSSVLEIGVKNVVSPWGILQGLSESKLADHFYGYVDPDCFPKNVLDLVKCLAQANKISFKFWNINDMSLDISEINPVDMLFIDSLHTYCHLTYELEKFSGKVQKYIAMHDTSEPWGTKDDSDYRGDYSEYPPEYNRNKKGLWFAVEDFLKRHHEWELYLRHFNNHGFTVLRRVSR